MYTSRDEIAPVKFTVGVDGQEPSSTFTSEPTPAVLDNSLSTANTSTCGCKPRAQGQLTLDGGQPASAQSGIISAIHEAVANENHMNKDDIAVSMVRMQNTTEKGHAVTEVTYRVECVARTCVIEDLLAPSEANLNNSLSSVGQTLYSKQIGDIKNKKVEEDEVGGTPK